jgi:hypothetical protein
MDQLGRMAVHRKWRDRVWDGGNPPGPHPTFIAWAEGATLCSCRVHHESQTNWCGLILLLILPSSPNSHGGIIDYRNASPRPFRFVLASASPLKIPGSLMRCDVKGTREGAEGVGIYQRRAPTRFYIQTHAALQHQRKAHPGGTTAQNSHPKELQNQTLY